MTMNTSHITVTMISSRRLHIRARRRRWLPWRGPRVPSSDHGRAGTDGACDPTMCAPTIVFDTSDGGAPGTDPGRGTVSSLEPALEEVRPFDANHAGSWACPSVRWRTE